MHAKTLKYAKLAGIKQGEKETPSKFLDRLQGLVAQLVKNPPSVQKIWVLSLGWKNPLKKEIVTHSSILVWGIPWTVEPGGLKESDMTKAT